MLAGDLYRSDDPELEADQHRARRLLEQINAPAFEADEKRDRLFGELLGDLDDGVTLRSPFRCDYGYNIAVGARTFINFGCVFLDCNRIEIAEEVQIGPGVHIYTATHPLDAERRRAGWEYALPVKIGAGVWLGGRAIVCPGVRIGENTVVGAGSVVTRDLPANMLAAGNPCRVVREL
jgi:maltose O-acetyltransferase